MFFSISDRFNDTFFIIDLVVTALIIALLVYFFSRYLKRRFIIYFYLIAYCVYLLAEIFTLHMLANIVLSLLAAATVLFFFVNSSEIRHLISNFKENKSKVPSKSKEFPKEKFYKTINDAVISLSKTKTGAILTFERNNNLSEIIKNGTIINAPVSVELLVTIFYPGTRLHDGAVVIRDNMILAASVYYTPTTRALTGKYGSRHRAAFGISEISDSVTVVVSEETGRISLAHDGTLDSVLPDQFLREFTDLMSKE